MRRAVVRCLALGAAVTAALHAMPVRAEGEPLPNFRLRYRVSGDKAACPDEASFRERVAVRLGYDAFAARDEQALRALEVDIEWSNTRRATIALRGRRGELLGKRVLGESAARCEDLVADAAFAASLAIDPAASARPTEARAERDEDEAPEGEATNAPVSPAPAAITRSEVVTRDAVPSSPSPPSRLDMSVRVGGGASFGLLPAASGNLDVSADVRRGAVSLGVGARLDTNASDTRGTAAGVPVNVEASLFVGEAHGCGHLGTGRIEPYACVAVYVGALRGHGSGIAVGRDAASPYVSAGPRLGLGVALTDALTLDARVDVPFALTTIDLRVDDRAAWTTPAVALLAGAGARWTFR